MRPGRLVLVWPLLAHAAAWVAFLWLVFWPFAYYGVSTQAAPPGSDASLVVTNLSASFIETNGIWVLLPLMFPVVLTGLAYLVVWYWSSMRWTRSVFLWVLAVLALGFCAMGYLSFGVLFLPAALALVITAIVSMFQAPISKYAERPISRLGAIGERSGRRLKQYGRISLKRSRLNSG